MAIGRHKYLLLWRRTFRLRDLKALSASMSSNASVDCSSKMSLIACTAASHPLAWPAQSCKFPAQLIISGLVTDIIALPTILRSTSPTPIGRTLGFLARGIKRHAV